MTWQTNDLKKEKKIRANFTIKKSVHEKFRNKCEKNLIPMSRYIERQMERFYLV